MGRYSTSEQAADNTINVDVFISDLGSSKEEIVSKFEELEKKLHERRQVLLAELCRIQERYQKSLILLES